MGKVIWKPGTFEYPIPAVMVTSGDFEKSNIMTVAWTGIINTDPAMCYISVRPSRYSYHIISETKEFAINLTNEKLAFATDWCLIKESPVSIECRVEKELNLGSHTMFIARVLSIDADEKYINEKGAFDISKCDLIAYANGGYYSLGKKVGTFGFSVRKKNKHYHS